VVKQCAVHDREEFGFIKSFCGQDFGAGKYIYKINKNLMVSWFDNPSLSIGEGRAN
jgi:hypothetical protein